MKSVRKYQSAVIRNEKCRAKLLKFRTCVLPKILKKYEGVLPGTDDFILWQCVLDQIFMKTFFNESEGQPAPIMPEARQLTTVEENAVRYTAGFVVHKLLGIYQKKKTSTASDYVDCLNSMTSSSDNYEGQDSMKWTQKTNRGGLCLVSDIAYSVFQEVEIITYPMIEEAFQYKRNVPVEDIKRAAVEDPDIQFFWTIIAVHIPDDSAQALLKELVEEWITLRVHSFGRRFMETYKTTTKSGTKRNRSLRKELQKKKKLSENESVG